MRRRRLTQFLANINCGCCSKLHKNHDTIQRDRERERQFTQQLSKRTRESSFWSFTCFTSVVLFLISHAYFFHRTGSTNLPTASRTGRNTRTEEHNAHKTHTRQRNATKPCVQTVKPAVAGLLIWAGIFTTAVVVRFELCVCL